MTETDDYFDGSLGIAIIGMAGRFPGAKDIDEFWENLYAGAETVHFFTDEELKAAGVTQAELDNPNYVKAAPILEDIEFFDASFFDYTPMEASVMDPQQRLLLECAWQSLEHAGYAGERDTDSIGVYAGSRINTYIENFFGHSDFMGAQGRSQIMLGNAEFALCTRISYKLNLKGPSYMVQTACSTSLAAVHLACQALLLDECRMALAGGVAIEVPHRVGYYHQYGGIVSPDGHCRSFDARAQGSVFGSGVGLVVLKRLDDALADGDTIYAVIKGTAVNNDGAVKASFTAPSVEAQTEVIMEALACSGVAVDSISYVEAHGSATSLGDPIEILALTNAFRAGTDKTGFCRIGSVKSNVGHLDAAAGIASLIKTVLALKHKMIPPSLHFEQPNPEIDFASSPFLVNTELTEWQTDGTPCRAGVNSLGFGGTNVHIILEEAPPVAPSGESRPWQLLALSAKTGSALNTATTDLAEHLKRHPGSNLADAAYTLQVGRKAFSYRRMLVCRDLDDAVTTLETREGVLTGVQETGDRPVAFMFPGVGDQYVNMALELYQVEPTFRAQVDHCSEILEPYLGLDLKEVLYPNADEAAQQEEAQPAAPHSSDFDLRKMLYPEKRTDEATRKLNQTSLVHPAIFTIEYALAQLLMEWGVRPQAMIGHSIGEYVAACLAGVFSLEDALALITQRAQLIQKLPGGAMLGVPLFEDEIQPFLSGEISLSAINAPSMCVLAGPTEAVAGLEHSLLEQGIACRRVQTSHAFHSVMMEPILEEFAACVEGIALNPPDIPFVSNVTGTWITADEAIAPAYWTEHLRQTVRFADGLRVLLTEADRVLLEVGPGRTLGTLAQQIDPGADLAVFSTIRPLQQQQSDVAFLLATLGQLWLIGQRVDWSGFYAHEQRHRVPLPTYPFERQRYWVDAPEQVGAGKTSRGSTGKKPDIADWFYIPVWKQSMPPIPLTPNELGAQRSCWLVFSDACGLGFQLAKRLEQGGQDVVTVAAGHQFAKLGDCAYTIHPQRPDDYNALLEALRDSNKIPQKIVHLWQVMPHEQTSSRMRFAETCLHLGFYSLFFLAQALGAHNISDALQIGVVSNNMQEVVNEDISYPEKATVLGPCKVIPQEYPHITCHSIDVVFPAPGTLQEEKLVGQLIAELARRSSDQIVAYRDRHRWVQTFDKRRLDGTSGWIKRLREGGTYLITGGLGGVGLAIAEYLARTVQAKLVLTRRSAFPDKDEWEQWLATHDDRDSVSDKIRKLQALERVGAEVMVARADVTDEEQMQAVVTEACERFGTIHGVIHAAGVAGGGMIQLKTPEMAAAVLAPKVKGVLVLDDLFKDVRLDFLVLFSSLSAILGEFGQVDYCAANAFLDAFARYNTFRHNRLTMSINWDAWREVGMNVNTNVPDILREWQEEQLKLAMSSSEGVEVFSRALSQSALPRISVCTTELYARIEQFKTLTQSQILEKMGQLSSPGLTHPRPGIKTPYVAPRDETEGIIADIWQRVLGIEQVGVNDNFFDLGGHSLLAIRIIGQLQDVFRVEFPLERLFAKPTVAGMARVVSELRAEQEDQDALEILEMLAQLSDEEADAELGEIGVEFEEIATYSSSELHLEDSYAMRGPMTHRARQLDYYTIIPHPTKLQILMLLNEDGWSLPHLVPTRDRFFAAVDDVNQAIQHQLGLTVTVLRCVEYKYNPEARTVAIYATENHDPTWTPSDGARWIEHRELNDLALAMPEQRAVLETWFAEAERGHIPDQRRPWARTGWFDTTVDWINAQLDRFSLAITGPIAQVRAWGISCVLRADTTARPVYFRAVPAKSAHEPLLLQVLAERYPAHFPGVLAIDAARHWVLMREVKGRPLLQVSDIKHWEEAIRGLAQIQIDFAKQTDSLLSWKCPDRRLDKLAAQIDPLFADKAALQRGQLGGLSEDEIGLLRALAPELKAMCTQLASYNIPHTLEHGDFHPSNIQVTDESHVYFDWGESSVAHPFFSLGSLEYYLEYVLPDMRDMRTRLRDVYLEPWTAYEPMERLLEAFELARPLSALHTAFTIYRIISSLEAAAKWEMEIESSLAFSLKMLLQLYGPQHKRR